MIQPFAFFWILLVFCEVDICRSFLAKQPVANSQRPQFHSNGNRVGPYYWNCLLSVELKRQCGLVRNVEKFSGDATPEKLMEQARTLRKEVQAHVDTSVGSELTGFPPSRSRWSVDTREDEGEAVVYRLYFDIGREEGTWMDPRWGQSGNRIQGSIDVALSRHKSQRVFVAHKARLSGGFDSMKLGQMRKDTGLSYRIERASRAGGRQIATATLRFSFPVDGTAERDSKYGDVFIPAGVLYFSLPAFGNGIDFLSTKDGVITVRQFGWHTGWWREESRIVGTFRLRPFDEARDIDGF